MASTIDDVAPDLARRAAEMFGAWRAAEPPRFKPLTPSELAMRAQAFLDQARPLVEALRRRLTEAPPAPTITAEQAAQVMSVIRGPLSAAERQGSLIDVWQVAGLRRNEVRVASVLSWLLSPQGSHGQGSAVLDGLLRRLAVQPGAEAIASGDLRRYTVRPEQRPLGTARDRVDIEIKSSERLIFVEVKIDAPEGVEQISRYLESATRKAAALRIPDHHVVYLTRTRRKDVDPSVLQITWPEVADIVRRAAPGGRADTYARLLMTAFANHVASL